MSSLRLPNKPKPYLMAHRGNRVLFPENTLSAFQQAAVDGADIIETDLQVTLDGAFMCLHDETVDRTTDGSGLVGQMTLEQARSFNAAASRPDLPPEPIPLIGEMAAVVPEDIVLALELKADAFTDPATSQRLLEELCREASGHRVVLLSFNPLHLETIRSLDPAIPIGWITTKRAWPRPGMELFGPYWPLLLMNPILVWVAHWMGQLICPLDPTPDNRLGMYRLLGCDAVLSDDPGKTGRALGHALR